MILARERKHPHGPRVRCEPGKTLSKRSKTRRLLRSRSCITLKSPERGRGAAAQATRSNRSPGASPHRLDPPSLPSVPRRFSTWTMSELTASLRISISSTLRSSSCSRLNSIVSMIRA